MSSDASVNMSTTLVLANGTSNVSCFSEMESGCDLLPSALARGARLVVPIIFGFIFLVGLLGNVVVLYLLVRHPHLRTTPNIVIACLALGDLLLILLAVPTSVTYFVLENWTFGEILCKFNEFIQTMSLGISVFSLVALCVERYQCISKPLNHAINSTQMMFVSVSIWIAASLLAIPDAIVANVVNNEGTLICYPFREEGHWYNRIRVVTRFLTYYMIPLVAFISLYSCIARVLLTTLPHLKQREMNSVALLKRLESRRKVVKVVLSFIIVFAVCWLPHHIFTFWFFFTQDDFNDFWLVFRIISFCLAFLNSCLNPVALFVLSEAFRTPLKRLFQRRQPRRSYSLVELRVSHVPTSEVNARRTGQTNMGEFAWRTNGNSPGDNPCYESFELEE